FRQLPSARGKPCFPPLPVTKHRRPAGGPTGGGAPSPSTAPRRSAGRDCLQVRGSFLPRTPCPRNPGLEPIPPLACTATCEACLPPRRVSVAQDISLPNDARLAVFGARIAQRDRPSGLEAERKWERCWANRGDACP